jgi:hypothetical protein
MRRFQTNLSGKRRGGEWRIVPAWSHEKNDHLKHGQHGSSSGRRVL